MHALRLGGLRSRATKPCKVQQQVVHSRSPLAHETTRQDRSKRQQKRGRSRSPPARRQHATHLPMRPNPLIATFTGAILVV